MYIYIYIYVIHNVIGLVLQFDNLYNAIWQLWIIHYNDILLIYNTPETWISKKKIECHPSGKISKQGNRGLFWKYSWRHLSRVPSWRFLATYSSIDTVFNESNNFTSDSQTRMPPKYPYSPLPQIRTPGSSRPTAPSTRSSTTSGSSSATWAPWRGF